MTPRARRLWPVLVAVALGLTSSVTLLAGTATHAIQNGDEAIYAQVAREMISSGDLADLRWQNDPQIVRPPGVIWTLAAARAVFPDERSVRWPLAAAAGAEVGLLFLLAFVLFPERRWLAGLFAAGALLTSDLFIGYARYLESEPWLCAWILAAVLAWELARQRPRFLYLWGACLGAALMTKQLVGALALVPALADGLSRDGIPWRSWRRGLFATLVVWAPWHVRQLIVHGGHFLAAYLGHNVLERAHVAILQTTKPTFYARELWRSEGLFAVLFAVAVGRAVLRGRDRRARLIALWSLGPFVVFSLAASRYDYYLLVIYPALALAAAELLLAIPLRPALQAALAAVWIVSAAGLHLARDLVEPFAGEDEVRALMHEVHGARLYTFNTHPYAARYYTDVDVATLLESQQDYDVALHLRAGGMPAPVIFAPDLGPSLATLPRPYWLLLPRARLASLPDTAHLVAVAESRHYVLYRAP